MSTTNPYSSPSAGSRQNSSPSVMVWFLCGATVVTAILSLVNALQESSFGFFSVLTSVSVPTFVQLFGLAMALVRKRYPSSYANVLVVPASTLAVLCVVSLSAWVAAGEFQEFEDATQFRKNLFQIHPVAIPFSLIAVSVTLYGVSIVFATLMLFLRLLFPRLKN